MKKLNTRGFALVETLIVSVFVMGIFILLYTNFYPLIGEYEKREGYDTISAVYKTDILKRYLSNSGVGETFSKKSKLDAPGGIANAQILECDTLSSQTECKSLLQDLNVDYIYVSHYACKINLGAIKEEGLKEYVEYKGLTNAGNIPNPYGYQYRIIVKYKRTVNEGTSSTEDVYEYATLGVDLN